MGYTPGKLKTKYSAVRLNEVGRNMGDVLEMMARYVVYGEGVHQTTGENIVFNELKRLSEENIRKIKDPYLQAWVDGSEDDEIAKHELNEVQLERFNTLRTYVSETLHQKELAREKPAATKPSEPSRRAEAVVVTRPVATRERAGAFLALEAPDEQVVKKNEEIKKLLDDRLTKVRAESKSASRDDKLLALLAISDFILKNYSKNKQVIDLDHVEDQLKRQYKSAGKLDQLDKFTRGISPTSLKPLASVAGMVSEYAKIKEKAAAIKERSLPEPEPKPHSKGKHIPT